MSCLIEIEASRYRNPLYCFDEILITTEKQFKYAGELDKPRIFKRLESLDYVTQAERIKILELFQMTLKS